MKILRDIKHNVKAVLPDVLKLRNTATQKADSSYVTEGDLLVDRVVAETILAAYQTR